MVRYVQRRAHVCMLAYAYLMLLPHFVCISGLFLVQKYNYLFSDLLENLNHRIHIGFCAQIHQIFMQTSTFCVCAYLFNIHFILAILPLSLLSSLSRLLSCRILVRQIINFLNFSPSPFPSLYFCPLILLISHLYSAQNILQSKNKNKYIESGQMFCTYLNGTDIDFVS